MDEYKFFKRFWAIYKRYKEDHDDQTFIDDMTALKKEYKGSNIEILVNQCIIGATNQAMAWQRRS